MPTRQHATDLIAIAVILVATCAIVWRMTEPLAQRAEPRDNTSPAHRVAAPVRGPFTELEAWQDVSNWRAAFLRAESLPDFAPSGAKITRLVEDTQISWRNLTTKLQSALRSKALRANAEVKGDGSQRQAVLFVYAGADRFSCNINLANGRTRTLTNGAALAESCTATRLPDGWWRVELMGLLSGNSPAEAAFVAIAITQNGFSEEFPGDGRSGLFVGGVALSQEEG